MIGGPGTTNWTARVAQIIDSIGSDALAGCVLSTLNEVVPFEHTGIFMFQAGRRPRDCLASQLAGTFHRQYCGGTYRLDPFYKSVQHQGVAGVFRMSDLDPGYQRYLENYQMGPRLADIAIAQPHCGQVIAQAAPVSGNQLCEEIGYLLPVGSRRVLHIALIRSMVLGHFSEQEIDQLRAIMPILQATFSRHFQNYFALTESALDILAAGDVTDPNDVAWLAQRVTRREMEVIRCVLSGLPTVDIAAHLKITPETVKVHRKNVYRKLSVSSRGELHELFRYHARRPASGSPPMVERILQEGVSR